MRWLLVACLTSGCVHPGPTPALVVEDPEPQFYRLPRDIDYVCAEPRFGDPVPLLTRCMRVAALHSLIQGLSMAANSSTLVPPG